VSWVGVLPTHRRRGVLGALMDFQLGSVRDAGREPIAVLWASEPQIYGRFGYGRASEHWSMTVPRSATALAADAPADPELRLRLVPPTTGRRPPASTTSSDPAAGHARRDDRWWARAVRDLPALRNGGSALRCVLAEDGHGVRGYARNSTKQHFDESFGSGRVDVREVQAVDPAALASLYRYLFDLDLMGTTSLWNVPSTTRCCTGWRTRAGPSRSTATRSTCGWSTCRAALSARTYATDVDVVLEVEDRAAPGTRAVAAHGRRRRGDLHPHRRPADLVLGARDLGAAYLGGTSLRRAGRGRPGHRRPRTRCGRPARVRSDLAPWCPVVF
jgi:hypothetical protein